MTIRYQTELAEHEWSLLVDLYDETNMFLGLGRARDLVKIKRACRSSLRLVTAWQHDKVVGAGRIISDGECYGWIHDVAVLPDFRMQGIGQTIIQRLIEGNEHLLIGLTSSFEAVEFYQKLDFKKHKTAMAKYPGVSDYLVYD